MQQPARAVSGVANRGEDQDGNKLGVKAGCISGLKKSTYTEAGTPHDFGVVVMSSFAVAHSTF